MRFTWCVSVWDAYHRVGRGEIVEEEGKGRAVGEGEVSTCTRRRQTVVEELVERA